MANRFSLEADILPTIDERAAQREADQLGEEMQNSIGDLSPGVDGDFDSFQGMNGGGAGGSGGGGVGGTAAAAGGLRGLGASGGLAKVALGGVVGFGILKGMQKLASASPMLESTLGMFGDAMELFFRPFGNILGKKLRPFAENLINAASNFNEIYQNEGLMVGLEYLSNEAVKSFTKAMTNVDFAREAGQDIREDNPELANFLETTFGTVLGTEDSIMPTGGDENVLLAGPGRGGGGGGSNFSGPIARRFGLTESGGDEETDDGFQVIGSKDDVLTIDDDQKQTGQQESPIEDIPFDRMLDELQSIDDSITSLEDVMRRVNDNILNFEDLAEISDQADRTRERVENTWAFDPY